MNQTTITRQELEDLIYEADRQPQRAEDDGYDDDDYDVGIRDDYSGRGMYGDRCVGLVVDDPAGIMFDLGVQVGIKMAEDSDRWCYWNEIAAALKDSRQDSMGRSSIVYFPYLAIEGADDYDE
jgi:hypothetical protein